MCQRLDFLWFYYPVVDSYVINQAGPVGPGFHSLAGADVKATGCYFKTILRIFGYFDIIDIEPSVLTIPDKTYPVPVSIGDDCLGEQGAGRLAGTFKLRHQVTF